MKKHQFFPNRALAERRGDFYSSPACWTSSVCIVLSSRSKVKGWLTGTFRTTESSNLTWVGQLSQATPLSPALGGRPWFMNSSSSLDHVQLGCRRKQQEDFPVRVGWPSLPSTRECYQLHYVIMDQAASWSHLVTSVTVGSSCSTAHPRSLLLGSDVMSGLNKRLYDSMWLSGNDGMGI